MIFSWLGGIRFQKPRKAASSVVIRENWTDMKRMLMLVPHCIQSILVASSSWWVGWQMCVWGNGMTSCGVHQVSFDLAGRSWKNRSILAKVMFIVMIHICNRLCYTWSLDILHDPEFRIIIKSGIFVKWVIPRCCHQWSESQPGTLAWSSTTASGFGALRWVRWKKTLLPFLTCPKTTRFRSFVAIFRMIYDFAIVKLFMRTISRTKHHALDDGIHAHGDAIDWIESTQRTVSFALKLSFHWFSNILKPNLKAVTIQRHVVSSWSALSI